MATETPGTAWLLGQHLPDAASSPLIALEPGRLKARLDEPVRNPQSIENTRAGDAPPHRPTKAPGGRDPSQAGRLALHLRDSLPEAGDDLTVDGRHRARHTERAGTEIEELDLSKNAPQRLRGCDLRRIIDHGVPLVDLAARALDVEDDPQHAVKRRSKTVGR